MKTDKKALGEKGRKLFEEVSEDLRKNPPIGKLIQNTVPDSKKVLQLYWNDQIVVRLPYDLRTPLEAKLADAHWLAGWTVYVNNRGTLAHAVHREGDFHIRFPLAPNVKTCAPAFVERLMRRKMEKFLVL